MKIPGQAPKRLFSASRLWIAQLGLFLPLAQGTPATPTITSLPFPWIIAHRGGDLLWPEETMSAYQASTEAGNPFVEVDCWRLRDGVVGLMHDGSLARTTGSKKSTWELDSQEWKELRVNGARLLGPGWGNYEPPFLDEVLVHFRDSRIIFIEPKSVDSGSAIVRKLKEYKVPTDRVVVNSFLYKELNAARAARYKTCPNLSAKPEITPVEAKKAGHWAVGLPANATEETVKAFKAQGLRVFIYTANRHYQRDVMLKWGVDGFYADDPLYMDPAGGYRRETDPFASQRWAPGMLEGQPGGRGSFVLPNAWRLDTSAENTFKSCLQGWMCPIGGKEVAPSWSMDLCITFGPRLAEGKWASVAILTADVPLNSDGGSFIKTGGYNVLFYNTGGLAIYKYDAAGKRPATELRTVPGKPIALGEKIAYRLTFTPEKILVERLDGKASLEVADAEYRGAYVTFGAKGQQADFSEVKMRAPSPF